MKVGDLVKLAKWCKNKHRLAIITEVISWDNRMVKIQFIDELNNLAKLPGRALKANLILLEEK